MEIIVIEKEFNASLPFLREILRFLPYNTCGLLRTVCSCDSKSIQNIHLISVDYTKKQVYNHKGCNKTTLLGDACSLFIRKFKYL